MTNDYRDLFNSFLRRLGFFLFDLVIFRVGFFKLLREYLSIKAYQTESLQTNIKIQKIRLFNLVKYAVEEIPYYKDLKQTQDIHLSKGTIFEDLKQFPILTKEIIRKNYPSFCLPHENKSYRINTSGGTTGEPIKILQDRNYVMKGYSATYAFNEFGNYFPGDKVVKLWGDEREILEHTRGLISKFIRVFKNLIFLNSFLMSKSIIIKYIKEINHQKPKIIVAYVQSIFEMAKFIKYNNLEIYSPDSIIVSSGVLTLKIKKIIEEVFNAEVYNRYGSREVGLIGMSCSKSDKLHVNIYHQFVEIVDKQGNRLSNEQKGHIVVTNLTNYKMPLIRYRIGDIGSLNTDRCKCGRGLVRLNNVYGRIVDTFKNSSGDIIDGEFFTHLFYFVDNIKKFQIVQEEVDLIKIKLVTSDQKKLSNKFKRSLEKKIKFVMGDNCQIKIEYFEKILPSESGKFRYTISKVE